MLFTIVHNASYYLQLHALNIILGGGINKILLYYFLYPETINEKYSVCQSHTDVVVFPDSSVNEVPELPELPESPVELSFITNSVTTTPIK